MTVPEAREKLRAVIRDHVTPGRHEPGPGAGLRAENAILAAADDYARVAAQAADAGVAVVTGPRAGRTT